ncbi:MAG: helix-turn-helix domain-containing protein [Azospirillaceae bacterium]|nr:helix-turn-helix domain-containing protein [Azospirillaceae bacterium]
MTSEKLPPLGGAVLAAGDVMMPAVSSAVKPDVMTSEASQRDAVVFGATPEPVNSRGAMTLHQPCELCPARRRSLCAALAPCELPALAQIAGHQEFAAHREVVEEGAVADAILLVLSGTLMLHKLLPDGRRQVTGFVRRGEAVNLRDQQGRYPCSVTAIAPTRLCCLPQRDLEPLMARFPALRDRLLNMALDALAIDQERMLLLGRKTARERLCSFLYEWAAGSSVPVDLPMMRADIADFLGLTTETVSRIFSRLKAEQMIRFPAERILQLADPEAMRATSAGQNG